MSGRVTSNDVAALLATWSERDEAAGRRAAARREAVLTAKGLPVTEYEFHVEPNDWVHLDWMRPVRFVYRNLPASVRMPLKKWMSR